MTDIRTLKQLEADIQEREHLQVDSAKDTAQMMGSYFVDEQVNMLTREGFIPATFKARQVWEQLLSMRGKLTADELVDYLASPEPVLVREGLHQMARFSDVANHVSEIGKILRNREDHGFQTVMCEAAIVLGRIGDPKALSIFDMVADYHQGVVLECIHAARTALEDAKPGKPPFLTGWPSDTREL